MSHRTDTCNRFYSRWSARVTLCLLALALAACAASPAPAQLSTEPVATETAVLPTATSTTPTPAPTPTESGPARLTIWWPEPLAPLDNETAAEVLSQQLSAFQRENSDISVDFRLKRVENVGGILSTLRAASAVAPGALPDLTLLRRDDMLIAAQAGLLHPLDNRVSQAVREDLPGVVLELGSYNDQLLGLPYTLELLHVAFPPGMEAPEALTLDSLLAEEIPFVFPAGRTSGLNHVLLVQYLAAGGAVSETGGLVVDASALRSTLRFYEEALGRGLVDPIALEYVRPTDYRSHLITESRGAFVVTSTMYLELVDAGVELGIAPIPTHDGTAMTVQDGWLWVLTTSDAERQERALRFLNWMLDAQRQIEYAQVLHMLPSQRTALRQLRYPEYARFVNNLLSNAILPLSESASGTTARAMQSALAAVMTGQRTAEEATRDVLNQLNN